MPRGAKPGERRGGRKEGTLNKKTTENAELEANLELTLADELDKAGIDRSKLTPLEFALFVLRRRDSTFKQLQWATKKAMAFCHAKFTTHQIQGAAPGAAMKTIDSVGLAARPSIWTARSSV
jgi:hypothetical protein